MICPDCEVAGYIGDELRFFSKEDPRYPAFVARAEFWHSKCLNWRGKNRKGCTCQHVV